MKKACTVNIVLAATLLTACATTPPASEPQWVWSKPSATGQDFTVDKGQCMQQAFQSPASMPPAPNAPAFAFRQNPDIFGNVPPDASVQAYNNSMFNYRLQETQRQVFLFTGCMNSKGWSQVPAGTRQNAPAPPVKMDPKYRPECDWGQYFSSVKMQCVKIGSE